MKKIFSKNRVFKSPVKVGKENITITLPKKVADYLGLTNNKTDIHWAAVNGVIQISGDQPNVGIPMMTISEAGFIPHEDPKKPEKVELPEVAEEVVA